MALPTAGTLAADIVLPGTDDRMYSTAEARARGPLLLTFFHLDCQACEVSYLFWDQAFEAFAGERFQLWAVSLDAKPDAEAFWEKSGVSFPVLFDDGTSAEKFGLVSTPSHVLVNADGTVQAAYEAFDRTAWNSMLAEIAGHLGQPVISVEAGEAADFRPGCTLHG